ADHDGRPPAGLRAQGAGLPAAAAATACWPTGGAPGDPDDRPCRRAAAGGQAMSIQGSLIRHLLLGSAAVVALMLIIFGWGTLTETSGAVIAPGKMVVDSNVKKVQPPTGGVVGDLRVKDGDRVKKGDIVVRLDETQARTSLAIVTKALDEMEG